MTRRANVGQALVETLVVSAALGVAFFYPYIHGDSVGTLLLRALMRALRARSLILSVM